MAVKQVYDGGPDGVTLGASASSLVSLYGVTPVAQAAAITSPDSTASTSTTNAFGYTTSTQADAIVTALRSLLTAARNVGMIAS
jgi:hypothetical protein